MAKVLKEWRLKDIKDWRNEGLREWSNFSGWIALNSPVKSSFWGDFPPRIRPAAVTKTLPQEIPLKQMICMGAALLWQKHCHKKFLRSKWFAWAWKQTQIKEVNGTIQHVGPWDPVSRFHGFPQCASIWSPLVSLQLWWPSASVVKNAARLAGPLQRIRREACPGVRLQTSLKEKQRIILLSALVPLCGAPSLPGRTGRKSQLRPFLQQVSGKGLPHLFQWFTSITTLGDWCISKILILQKYLPNVKWHPTLHTFLDAGVPVTNLQHPPFLGSKVPPHHSLTRGCHTQCEFLPHRRLQFKLLEPKLLLR